MNACHSRDRPFNPTVTSHDLSHELAVISSVQKENPEAFRRGLLGWIEWSNQQPELGVVAIDPTWSANRLVSALDDARVQRLAKMLTQIQTMPLRGYQLSFIDGIEPYYIENPRTITTASGTATVTRTEMIGPSQVIWADYGSGQEHPHRPEDVVTVNPPPKRKRYPGKGRASGWIEMRRTNRKRQKPSEYLVYRWQDADGKHSRYLKKAIAPQVREMIAGGAMVREILAVMHQVPRESGGFSHTDGP